MDLCGMTLKFKDKFIKEAEDHYRTAHIDDQQKGFVDAFAKMFHQALPISELSIKGFMWYSIKDYQMKHKVDLRDIVNLDPQARFKVGLEVSEYFKNKLKSILRDPSQESLLDEAMDKVVKLYKQKI